MTLPRPTRSDQGHDTSGRNFHGDVSEYGLAGSVFEGDVFERDGAGRISQDFRPGPIPDGDGCLQEFEDALSPREPGLHQRRELGRVLHGPVELETEGDETDELGPAQRSIRQHQPSPVQQDDDGANRRERLGEGAREGP